MHKSKSKQKGQARKKKEGLLSLLEMRDLIKKSEQTLDKKEGEVDSILKNDSNPPRVVR